MKKHFLFTALSIILVVAMALTFVACDLSGSGNGGTGSGTGTGGTSEHEHSYSEKWTWNETEHWHAATCEHNDQVSDKSVHSFNTDGECTVCGYVVETGSGGTSGGTDSGEETTPGTGTGGTGSGGEITPDEGTGSGTGTGGGSGTGSESGGSGSDETTLEGKTFLFVDLQVEGDASSDQAEIAATKELNTDNSSVAFKDGKVTWTMYLGGDERSLMILIGTYTYENGVLVFDLTEGKDSTMDEIQPIPDEAKQYMQPFDITLKDGKLTFKLNNGYTLVWTYQL